jgi:hypothetical protein
VKTSDIKTDGTVYWFERSNDWGHYSHPGFDRHPVIRVDDNRYMMSTGSRTSAFESSKGHYVATYRVDKGGTADTSRVIYVLAAQVRDTYQAVMERVAAYKAAATAQHEKTAAIAAAKADEAAELRDRLADIGIDDLFHVRSTEGFAPSGDDPRVIVELEDRRDAAETLRKLIERLEAEGYGLGGKHLGRTSGYAVGKTQAGECVVDSATGWCSTHQQYEG